MTNVVALDQASIEQQISIWVLECRQGESDREAEALTLAGIVGIDAEGVKERFKDARELRDKPPPIDEKPQEASKEPDFDPALNVSGDGKSQAEVFLTDVDAPYEVARKFLVHRHLYNGVPTLRYWCGGWRKWKGTHYTEFEEDEVRSQVYDFFSKANGGKFDPQPKHVNAVIDCLKSRVLLPAEVAIGAWLDDTCAAPWAV